MYLITFTVAMLIYKYFRYNINKPCLKIIANQLLKIFTKYNSSNKQTNIA